MQEICYTNYILGSNMPERTVFFSKKKYHSSEPNYKISGYQYKLEKSEDGLKKGRLPQKWRRPQKIIMVLVSVPKQCFQPQISLKVVNGSLA